VLVGKLKDLFVECSDYIEIVSENGFRGCVKGGWGGWVLVFFFLCCCFGGLFVVVCC
jgi:hypothetical protein